MPSLRLAILVAVLVGAFANLLPAFAQVSDEDGVIFGQVVNSTVDQPVPEVAVTLSTFAGGTLQADRSTVTDETGRFEFPGVTTDPEAVFAVSTSYFGIGYSTGRISFEAESVGIDVTLDVFDPTDDQSLVGIFSRGLILTDIEPNRGEAGLLDIYFFGMTEPRVLVANDEGRTVEFPVPRNATRVTPLPDESFDLTTATIEGATVYGTEPLLPGETTSTLTYTIPYTGERLNVELLAAYDTQLFRLLVPISLSDLDEPVALDAPGFESAGQEQIGPQTYNVWVRENVETGDRIQIAYSNLIRSEIQPNTLNKSIPALVAIAAFVAAAAGAVWIVRSRKLERERPAVLAPQLASSLEDQRQELIDQLRALQQAHDEGIVGEQDYVTYRREILEQMRVVNRQMRGAGVED